MSQRSANPAALLPLSRTGVSQVAMPSRARTVVALLLGDFLSLALASTFGVLALDAVGIELGTDHAILASLFIAFGLIAYSFAGLYPGVGVSEVDELRLQTAATTIVWCFLLPTALVLGGAGDIWQSLLTWSSALLMVPLLRAVIREFWSDSYWWGVPVVVLSAGGAGRRLVERLQQQPRSSLRPVAIFDDDSTLSGTYVRGLPVEGRLSDCTSFSSRGVRHAIVTATSLGSTQLQAMIAERAACFPNIIVLPDLEGMSSINASAAQLGGELAVRLRQNLLVRRHLIVKRIIDLFLLVPTGLVALVVVALASIAIRLVSPGSAFYSQEREGLGGRTFRMWKLRTMYLDAESRLEKHLEENPSARAEWHRSYKLKNDPRILPGIGHFLRKTSLDEVPQLWNIARGEMSFVGPRPFPGYHLAAFDPAFRALRRKVRPGLTGLWQVTARSDSDLGQQKELDSYYIANWSPWMDIYVLTRTPVAVLTGNGAR